MFRTTVVPAKRTMSVAVKIKSVVPSAKRDINAQI